MTDPKRLDRPRDGRAVAIYTAARAALLVLCLLLGWVAGLTGPFLVIVALLVSGVLSWFLLGRQRSAMSGAVERRVERAKVLAHRRAAAEDAYVDSLQGRPSRDRTG